MISQLEIYHDDVAYVIKEKINELVDAVNELVQITESLRSKAEQLELNFDHHTHGYENSATGYPLITMVDEHGSIH